MEALGFGLFIKSIVIFLSLGTLLIAIFSANVSRLRGKTKIFLGDGGNKELEQAIRAHLNFIEHYVPFALVMVFYMFLSSGIYANIFAFGFLLFKSLHSYSLAFGGSKLHYTFAGVMLLEILVPLILLIKIF